MKYLIPGYLLDAVVRHYETLALSYVPDGKNNMAANAKRVAGKEIQKLKSLISKQWKETLEN